MTPTDVRPTRRRRSRRWSRQWWLRRVVAFALVVGVACGVLMSMDEQVTTAVGAEGVGDGIFPVVEVAGLGSDGHRFATMTRALRERGVPVLDLDPNIPGTQPLTYRPAPREDIPEVADRVVDPAIRAALRRAGYDPDTQRVDVVAHSMGGLLMRSLIERDGSPWADRVDDLVMIATPNHGSDVIGWETSLGRSSSGGLGDDMTPGSAFLDSLGYAEPPGQTYTTIGGDPWMFRWYRHGSHGFDDQVPAESPFLTGAANNTQPYLHGRLVEADPVVDLVVRTVTATAPTR